MRLICALYKPPGQAVPPSAEHDAAGVVPSLFPFAAHPSPASDSAWSTLRQLVNGGSPIWLAAVVARSPLTLPGGSVGGGRGDGRGDVRGVVACWTTPARGFRVVKSRGLVKIARRRRGPPDARLLFVVSLGAGDTTGADERASARASGRWQSDG